MYLQGHLQACVHQYMRLGMQGNHDLQLQALLAELLAIKEELDQEQDPQR